MCLAKAHGLLSTKSVGQVYLSGSGGARSLVGSRSGLYDQLVDPMTNRPAAARAVAYQLPQHVRPALMDAGEFSIVKELLEDLLARGNGAWVLRQACRRANQVLDVVREAIARTPRG